MTKKIIVIGIVAVLLIAVLAFFAILAPGSRNDDVNTPQDTTTAASQGGENNPSETTSGTAVSDGLPDNLSFGGAPVTFLIWSDHTMKEFYSDEIIGDLIGDEIHYRNEAVKERLGVDLVYKETPGSSTHMNEYIKVADTDVNSGACEYQIYAGYSRTAPAMALSGKVMELTERDYLDFSKPWWPSVLIDECMINNKLFYCSGDISTNLLWMMTATFFNKDLVEKYDIEDPYDLVHKNEWTIDKLIEITSNRYTDLNGDGTADNEDFYGYIMYSINIDALFTAVDFISLEKSSEGKIVISPDLSSTKIYDLLDKLGNYVNSADVKVSDSTTIRDVFFNERSIMATDRVFVVAGKDNGTAGKIEFAYGILPQPKNDSSQENYSTSVGHPYTMYALSIGIKTDEIADMCAATLECLASESYARVTPKVFEEAMKVKYADDEVASEMYDILRSTIRFDLGRLYSSQIGDVYKTMRTQVINNSKTFASQYKGISRLIENGIKVISAAYED